MARILKKGFNCFGKDFAELNAANVRGIDTIREIDKTCRFAPMMSSCRIFLLDEAHKLTKDAQNALLKLLEDTPSHVYFFLCTTEPEKLIPTIRNRCTHFQVSSLPDRTIVSLLKDICEKEKVDLPKEALSEIAKISEGSPRQALVILDSVIDIETDEDLLKAIQDYSVRQSGIFDLSNALLVKSKWKDVIKILSSLDMEPENVRYSILGIMNSKLMKGENKRASYIIEEFLDSFMYSKKAGLTNACYRVVVLKGG
jgi:DNA polymerase III subunit gamma/tau